MMLLLQERIWESLGCGFIKISSLIFLEFGHGFDMKGEKNGKKYLKFISVQIV
jgi:hypothetical protein